MTAIRRLGDGYEPHVDEEAGVLTYTLPVDSSFVSTVFSFRIQPEDLAVLLDDPYRRAALEVVAHTALQRSMLRDQPKVTQADFDALVTDVLHATPGDLETFVDRVDREHHTSTWFFMQPILERRLGGA